MSFIKTMRLKYYWAIYYIWLWCWNPYKEFMTLKKICDLSYDINAQHLLSKCYLLGVGVEPSFSKGMKLIKEASTHPHATAKMQNDYHYFSTKYREFNSQELNEVEEITALMHMDWLFDIKKNKKRALLTKCIACIILVLMLLPWLVNWLKG